MTVNVRPLAALGMILLFAADAFSNDSSRPADAVVEPAVEQEVRLLSVPSPLQMVRTLHLMQDQIATGSTEAHIGQRGLLGVLDTRFMELEPEVWQNGKNIHAAVSFVLSGGNPGLLRKLLELGSSVVTENDRPLVEGALAYVEGREEAAYNALMSLDPRTFPPTMSAQLALVQSALVVRKDPAKSDDLLDFVRLQAPGSLLEEAALRRQVFVASQTGHVEKFQSLATGYLRRFRHSVYAGNFRQRLASASTRIDFGQDKSRFDGFVIMMKELEPEARRDLYLLTARASVEQGFTKSARLLSEEAQKLVEGDLVSASRAKLYRAASMITSPENIKAAAEDLRQIDRSLLPASDVALLDSAMAMAEHIQTMPGTPGVLAEKAKPLLTKAAAEKALDTSNQTQGLEQLQALSKARDALSRVDRLIKNQASVTQ
ncbi:chemotaxis protein MotC [Microvirga terrestris]|uniref:Chemotaxis protein MotC n=1 Tax=Microvirga terrestris TaxID=2791024 RepID=A0ABS0HQZ2_9HYPH|nr:chemotaxis protein MotC [Microvirga terrestris]MBF9195891.1 chemotaxis protein MotC [Microvirga terrestris]